jgi:hypothetical protein
MSPPRIRCTVCWQTAAETKRSRVERLKSKAEPFIISVTVDSLAGGHVPSTLTPLRVEGSGFRVQGSGFRVQGSGVRGQGAGFRVQGAGYDEPLIDRGDVSSIRAKPLEIARHPISKVTCKRFALPLEPF